MNGLGDVIASLKFIKQIIESFGGDSENITISGLSSGASIVCLLGVSPPAKGLFKKIIVESGSCIDQWAPLSPEKGGIVF